MPIPDPAVRLEWIDVDVGGDVHRVVFEGVSFDPQTTVRERMDWLSGPGDGLRNLLIEPPYGQPAFCVDLITPPRHPDAQAAFVIMEVMGYPFFSGSNTMATACALLEGGVIPLETTDGMQCVRLETPGGRVDAFAELVDGRVVSVSVEGDEAFVHRAGAEVYLPALGPIAYDLVWSGGHYVMVNAESVGLLPQHAGQPDGLALAAQIIDAVQADFDLLHPRLGDVGLPRFLHWMWPELESVPGYWTAVGGTYGHPGVLWGCPTGTGTAARLALLAHRGQAAAGASLSNSSPSGATFEATLLETGEVGTWPSIRTRVVGQPRVLGAVALDLPGSSPAFSALDLDWLRQPAAAIRPA